MFQISSALLWSNCILSFQWGTEAQELYYVFQSQCRIKQQDSFTSYLSPSQQLHLLLGDMTNKIFFFFLNWIFTLILELGFNMMYLIEPWMFSVHDTSQVTLLSCRTSFHLCPGGGGGILESLQRITKQQISRLPRHQTQRK